MGGKLAGQIVSGIFSGGGNKPSGSQQHNYGGQQPQGSHGGAGGGLVGSLIGGAAGMFGGKHNQQVRDAKDGVDLPKDEKLTAWSVGAAKLWVLERGPERYLQRA